MSFGFAESLSSEVSVQKTSFFFGTEIRIRLNSAIHTESYLFDLIQKMFFQFYHVEALTRADEAGSDLTRLNQLPLGSWCRVSSHTARILQFAETLRVKSQGLFNLCFHESWSGPSYEVQHFCKEGPHVRKLKKSEIDLGRLPFGYAVDLAYLSVESLNRSGEVFGVIEAGQLECSFENQSLVQVNSKKAGIKAASAMVAEAISQLALSINSEEEQKIMSHCRSFFRVEQLSQN